MVSKILLEQPFTELNYSTNSNKTMLTRKTAISNEAMKAKIDAQGAATAGVLREVEDNFITSTKAHITYHEYLMKATQESGDMNGYMHHRVMMETYETILKNYEASRRYGCLI